MIAQEYTKEYHTFLFTTCIFQWSQFREHLNVGISYNENW